MVRLICKRFYTHSINKFSGLSSRSKNTISIDSMHQQSKTPQYHLLEQTRQQTVTGPIVCRGYIPISSLLITITYLANLTEL